MCGNKDDLTAQHIGNFVKLKIKSNTQNFKKITARTTEEGAQI